MTEALKPSELFARRCKATYLATEAHYTWPTDIRIRHPVAGRKASGESALDESGDSGTYR
jgi:hypothetical protein